jgi:hypothetical protein
MKGASMIKIKTRFAIVGLLLLAALIIVLLTYTIRPKINTSQTPTISLNRVQTEAVATFASGLTQTAFAIPTSRSTNTSAPTSTLGETEAISPTASCYRLKYIRDVTIPDNTQMNPAEVFTKTWLVENIGLCAWRPGFKLILVGGAAMGGSPYTLIQSANPGDRIEISVKMAAPPNQIGTTQGTWRMTDENGTLFGDALTVVIDIGGTSTRTPQTPLATTTPS